MKPATKLALVPSISLSSPMNGTVGDLGTRDVAAQLQASCVSPIAPAAKADPGKTLAMSTSSIPPFLNNLGGVTGAAAILSATILRVLMAPSAMLRLVVGQVVLMSGSLVGGHWTSFQLVFRP
jgi:hypothetical protein